MWHVLGRACKLTKYEWSNWSIWCRIDCISFLLPVDPWLLNVSKPPGLLISAACNSVCVIQALLPWVPMWNNRTWALLFSAFWLVENENHCDFVKLREMLICTNMEDLRDQTHTRHYELYRRCRLEEMGFADMGPESKPRRWAAHQRGCWALLLHPWKLPALGGSPVPPPTQEAGQVAGRRQGRSE